MDAEDLGDGWENVAGCRAGDEKMRWNNTHITVGCLLARKAGLEAGQKVRLLLNRDEGQVALQRADKDEVSANRLSSTGGRAVTVSSQGAATLAEVELPLGLDVQHVEDGLIVASYE